MFSIHFALCLGQMSSRQWNMSRSDKCPLLGLAHKTSCGRASVLFSFLNVTRMVTPGPIWRRENDRAIVRLESQRTAHGSEPHCRHTATIADIELPCVIMWARNQLLFWWTITCLALFVNNSLPLSVHLHMTSKYTHILYICHYVQCHSYFILILMPYACLSSILSPSVCPSLYFS